MTQLARPAAEAVPPEGVDRFGSRLLWVTVAVAGLVAGAGAALLVWTVVAAEAGDEPAVVAAEAPVTAMDLTARRAHTSPVVAVDPTTADFVAAATRTDAPQPGCGLQVSGSGGAGWVPVDAVEPLPEGLESCFVPQVGFGPDGQLVFLFVGVGGASSPQPDGLFVVTSDDHAQTFTQPRQVAEVATFATSVAVGDEGLDVVWLDPAAGGDDSDGGSRPQWPVGDAVVAASGDVSGLSSPVEIADPDGLVAAPTVVAGRDGEAAVAYYELPAQASTAEEVASLVGEGPWQLMVAYREAGGEGFGDPMPVATFELPDQPELTSAQPPEGTPQPHLLSRWGIAPAGLAVDDGRVCAAWTDTSGDDGGLQAWASCSEEAAGSWEEPVNLAAGLAGESAQWLPQLAIGPRKQVQAVFYATHEETAGGFSDVWYASSSQPADGFDEPLRLSSSSSHPAAAPARFGWYGTRLGLAPGGEATVAAWADSRSGLPVYPSQTIFAATIDTPADEPAWAGWVGAGLLAGGAMTIGGGVWLRHRRTPQVEGEPAGDDVDAAQQGQP